VIELEDVPELIDPVMVAAFEGWNDAGDAASSAVQHLDEVWGGKVFAALDAEEYYDFQVNRPTIWMDGGTRRITWPTTRLSVVRVSEPKTRDLVLVRGIEPSMRWRSFCNELLGFAHELGVEMVVVLGALLGDTPHTRPVPVSGVTSDPDLARTMDLEESRYEGPTGIVGVLQEACAHAGVPAVTLWAAVPHYVAQPPNPKATLALLNKVEDLLDLRIPTGDLPEDSRAWQIGVDQLAAEDSEVAEYVQQLEEARDTAELPEASGDAIAREFERYLRRRDNLDQTRGGRGDGPGGAGGSMTSGTGAVPRGGEDAGAGETDSAEDADRAESGEAGGRREAGEKPDDKPADEVTEPGPEPAPAEKSEKADPEEKADGSDPSGEAGNRRPAARRTRRRKGAPEEDGPADTSGAGDQPEA